MDFILHKLGSDPEGLFIATEDCSEVVVPAPHVVGRNKTLTLKSFIGTDGHAATAEFRPTPAHNIYRHLYDLAAAIDATAAALASRQEWQETTLVARPWALNEPLGGHIHLSFFVRDAVARDLERANCYSQQGEVRVRNEGIRASALADAVECWRKASGSGRIFEVADFARGLDSLLLPLEMWLQPWHDRRLRNARYGAASNLDSRARMQGGTPRPDVGSRYAELAWFHMEYRTPSTWLVHPQLAYVYFALAKLTGLNWALVQDPEFTFLLDVGLTGSTPSNKAWGQILQERLARLVENPDWRSTPDCRQLSAALAFCGGQRSKWWGKQRGIVDTEAWRELLVK